MKLLLTLGLLVASVTCLSAQPVTVPAASPRAGVSQIIGITKVSVNYSRPSVNDREVWGTLVPYGLNDLGFGTSTESPWRAGADENTVITFAHDVEVGGQSLAAGAYGLHMVVTESGDVTVIFSRNADAWGSFFYDPGEDAVRFVTKWEDGAHHELLTYEFTDVEKNRAILALSWARKRIPLEISIDTDAVVVASLKRELTSGIGFDDRSLLAASAYLEQNNLDLHLALEWAERASSPRIGQGPTFRGLAQQALILAKLERSEEADALMDQALPLGTPGQIHQYGRSLLNAEKLERGLKVFQYNAERFPDVWPVNYGLARGYSAVGDYPAALAALRKARQNLPAGDTLNGPAIEANLEKLNRGEDIN